MSWGWVLSYLLDWYLSFGSVGIFFSSQRLAVVIVKVALSPPSLVIVCFESLCFLTWFLYLSAIVQIFFSTAILCFCLPGRVKRTLWTQHGEIHAAAPLKGQWFMRLALLSLGLGGIAGIIFCKWVWKCSWPGWPGLIYSSRCTE